MYCVELLTVSSRALRVMRVSLLAGELGQMHLTSSGALLTGAASVRLFQLIASVATLVFTASSVIVLLERRAFHDALYFVITTLTTVRRYCTRQICCWADRQWTRHTE